MDISTEKVHTFSSTVVSQNTVVRSKMENLSKKAWKRRIYSDSNRHWVIYACRLYIDEDSLLHIENFQKPTTARR